MYDFSTYYMVTEVKYFDKKSFLYKSHYNIMLKYIACKCIYMEWFCYYSQATLHAHSVDVRIL